MSTNVTEPSQCTYSTCSLADRGQLRYIPSLGGNVLYLTLFAGFLIAQIALGIRYKTWTYLIAMIGGIFLELIGYAGRLMLHYNDFDENNFIIYLVGLTIGPAFFSAAIYLCLSRIIAVFGSDLSFLRGKTITTIFICCDLVSLILQAGGGGIVASVNAQSSLHQPGMDLMIAGLASQVCSMTIFICVCLQLAWSTYNSPSRINPNSGTLRRSRGFKSFLFAIAIATITVLIRCCFRVAELQGGFGSSLANNQVAFMILDGAMMVIAVSCLTFAHPGPILGPVWHLQRVNSSIDDSRTLNYSLSSSIEAQKP